MDDALKSKLTLSLFLLRIAIAIVFFMWVLDKFVNPEHAALFFAHFYKISSLSEIAFYLIGGVQMALIFAFAAISMLSACYALWLLRDSDTLFSFDSYRANKDV